MAYVLRREFRVGVRFTGVDAVAAKRHVRRGHVPL